MKLDSWFPVRVRVEYHEEPEGADLFIRCSYESDEAGPWPARSRDKLSHAVGLRYHCIRVDGRRFPPRRQPSAMATAITACRNAAGQRRMPSAEPATLARARIVVVDAL